MRLGTMQRVIAVQLVAIAVMVAVLFVQPAQAEQPECNNLPGGGTRGVCNYEGQPSACLPDDDRYCIYSGLGKCFTGECTAN